LQNKDTSSNYVLKNNSTFDANTPKLWSELVFKTFDCVLILKNASLKTLMNNGQIIEKHILFIFEEIFSDDFLITYLV